MSAPYEAMSTLSSHTISFAQQIEQLIINHQENNWLKTLHIDDEQTIAGSSTHLSLATKNTISPENSPMAASRFAKALLPALLSHRMSEDHLIYSIRIRPANEYTSTGQPVDRGLTILDQALGFDLSDLRNTVIHRLQLLGMEPNATSFYNIELGGTNFRIITVQGQSDSMNLGAFHLWRKELQQEYGVNIRFHESRPTKSRLIPAENSDLSPSALEGLSQGYARTSRTKPIPSHLPANTEDWRDLDFMSIDSSGTLRPTDINKLERTPNNHIILRTAIPFSTSEEGFYSPFKDLISIGVTQEFDRWGEIVSRKVTPVIAHNCFPLDSYTVSCAANGMLFSPHSLIGQRIAHINDHAQLSDQIDLFYDLADRIISKQTAPGVGISFHLTREKCAHGTEGHAISSDYLVSSISQLTQHAIAEWALSQPGVHSLIALRPEFKPHPTLDAIRAALPSFSYDDLLNPKKLDEIGMQLYRRGLHNLNELLAGHLESGPRRQRITLISSSESIVPDDRIRLKSIHSGIGKANNLQVQSLLLGLPTLSDSVLQGVINTIRRDSSPVRDAPAQNMAMRSMENLDESIRKRLGGMKGQAIL